MNATLRAVWRWFLRTNPKAGSVYLATLRYSKEIDDVLLGLSARQWLTERTSTLGFGRHPGSELPHKVSEIEKRRVV